MLSNPATLAETAYGILFSAVYGRHVLKVTASEVHPQDFHPDVIRPRPHVDLDAVLQETTELVVALCSAPLSSLEIRARDRVSRS